MPEEDTIFRAARTLNRALAGQEVTGFESVLPKLSRVDFDSGVVGRTIEEVSAQGKWIRMVFSGDLTLLTHMLMSGSWHIYRPGEAWQRRAVDMRIVVKTKKIWAVAFNVPIAEFHTTDTLRRRPGFKSLGQDVLGGEFDAKQSIESLRAHGDLEVGAALLTQSIMAGMGNVFKSEVCFACGEPVSAGSRSEYRRNGMSGDHRAEIITGERQRNLWRPYRDLHRNATDYRPRQSRRAFVGL